jgi:hypothetical protein
MTHRGYLFSLPSQAGQGPAYPSPQGGARGCLSKARRGLLRPGKSRLGALGGCITWEMRD